MGAPLHCMLNPQWSRRGRGVPTGRTVASLVEPRRKGFNFKADKEIPPAIDGRFSVGAQCFETTNPEKKAINAA